MAAIHSSLGFVCGFACVAACVLTACFDVDLSSHPRSATAAAPPPAPCPESSTKCMTVPECAYDEKRECTMCRCSPAAGGPPAGMVNAESVPPIH